jgi:murein DD-endopeptidase MepM/ murein hydrolase activator NlpD
MDDARRGRVDPEPGFGSQPRAATAGMRAGTTAACIALLVSLALTSVSCGSSAPTGFYHRVRAGENLYRIGLRYRVPTKVLVRSNRIRDVTSVRVGTKLWIPRRRGGSASKRPATSPKRVAAIPKSSARRPDAAEARRQARREAKHGSKLSFAWPVKGRLTSSFGRRRGRPHEGVDVAARTGTSIRASESGKVIHSGRLGDYGKVVIVKHQGNYRTVYAHASKTLVAKGQFVEKGQKIALVGRTGRATGPHLHFEIRRRASARDPILYLP